MDKGSRKTGNIKTSCWNNLDAKHKQRKSTGSNPKIGRQANGEGVKPKQKQNRLGKPKREKRETQGGRKRNNAKSDSGQKNTKPIQGKLDWINIKRVRVTQYSKKNNSQL